MWAHLPKKSVCYPHLTIHTSQCDIVTEGMLGCYREVMMQRDITVKTLTNMTEAHHRDSLYYCLLKNPFIVPSAKVRVEKVSH